MSGKVSLQIGDEVSFLDEEGRGRVLRLVGKDRAVVRTQDGFELEYPVKMLVKRAAPNQYAITEHQARLVASNDRMLDRIDKDKGRGASLVNGGKVVKRVEDPTVMEVDLHLEKLLDNEAGLSDGEKLNYQLDYFERMLNTAIRERKRRLVVIHGVGEGVLREEVRKVLQFYEGCRFDDADPRRYGGGATVIDIVHY
ncbi:MAG: Smr/MutS family protein [Flavobacteriales bacterium]